MLRSAAAAAAGRTSREDGEGGNAERKAEILGEEEEEYDEERGVYVPTEVSGVVGRVVWDNVSDRRLSGESATYLEGEVNL